MKRLCRLAYTLVLLTFATLAFLPNAFTQDTLFQPRVSLIYFLPKDRPTRPDRITALRELIQDTQTFFADEMERHGYGRKTFTLETDRTGEPVVHQIHGKFNDAHYRRRLEAIDEVWAEVKEQFDSPQRIYFIAIDINSEMIVPWGGAAKGYYEPRGKGALMAASGDGFNLPLAAHELGHAFALEHDFRDPVYIMSYGRNRHQLSKCAAVWLDAHVFFNNASAQVNRDARIQMLSPMAAPNGIRLRFEVADADGLHQAMLYLKPTLWDSANDFKLDGCHLLDAENSTIEFVTSELVDPSQDEITLQVIDKYGGMKRQTFPINSADLLPPPKYVSIPDPNLARAIRETLRLDKNARITDQQMRSLTELDARKKQIKDLTGLEQATRLRVLELRENQISDIRPVANLKSLQALMLDFNNVDDIKPLANLTQLTWLLLGKNPISDFTPLDPLNQLEGLAIWGSHFSNTVLLADMTQLTHLWVGDNKINDVTPLTNLTQLQFLYLPHNQISNVAPLEGLANLETLHLQDNSIRDISPLTGLTKLKELRLGDNPITDKSPLQLLKDRNPELKLDIEIPRLSPVVHLEAAQRPPLYWVGETTGTLHRLIGDEVENLVPNVQNATSLAVDVASGKLYWTEETSNSSGRVSVANLDGTQVKLVKDQMGTPLDLALDTTAGKLYLINVWGKVQHLNVDGSNFQPNFITDLKSPNHLTLDVAGGQMYWTEQTGDTIGRIRRANLDGSNIQNVATGLTEPLGLAVANDKIYWTQRTPENSGKLQRADLDGTNSEVLETLPIAPTSIAIDPARNSLYLTTPSGEIHQRNLDDSGDQPIVTGLVSASNIVLGISATPPVPTDTTVPPSTPVVDTTADVNQDQKVNKTDLILVVTALGESPPANPNFDVNTDGTVNIADVLLVIEALDDPIAAAAPALGKTITAVDPRRLAMQIDILRAESDGSLKYEHAIAFFQSLLASLRPSETQLLANYPNPFNPETWIPYQLAVSAAVTVTIYNFQGRVVRTLELGHQRAGIYHSKSRAAYWDGRNALGEPVASGVYFYTLNAGDFTATRKLLIQK